MDPDLSDIPPDSDMYSYMLGYDPNPDPDINPIRIRNKCFTIHHGFSRIHDPAGLNPNPKLDHKKVPIQIPGKVQNPWILS